MPTATALPSPSSSSRRYRNLHAAAPALPRVARPIEHGIVVDDALALAKAVGWEWTSSSIARVLAMQPEGAFTARGPAGEALGIVTCVLWDERAWIGSMIVAPSARRAGVGRALLRHAIAFAEERGARSIGLDATPEGRALYETEGFVPAWGESAVWTRAEGLGPRAQKEGAGDHAIYPVSPAEIMELLAYDKPRFGAGRGRYLAALMSERQHQAFVAVNRKTGAFEGHVFATERGAGPMMADAPEAATRLLHAIEGAGATPRAIVPAWNPDAERVFEAAGFARGRSCVRMVRGEALAGRREAWYAVGAWALG